MDRMGYPRGLIRYSSENELEKQKTSRVRPRLLGYGAVLGALIGVFGYSLSHRVPLGLDIIRDRSRLYREFWDGSVENVYTLEIANREDRERTYRIRAAAPIPLELDTGSKSREVTVPGGRQVEVPVRLHARRVGPEAEKIPVTFTVETVDDPHLETTEPSRFVHPGSDE
jgi:polyferredoxin